MKNENKFSDEQIDDLYEREIVDQFELEELGNYSVSSMDEILSDFFSFCETTGIPVDRAGWE